MALGLAFNKDLQIYEAKPGDGVVNASSRLHIANARLSQPEYINSAITYMAGNGGNYQTQNFPLFLELYGKGRKKGIKNIDNRYKIKMYGKPKRITTISKAITQTNCGANGAHFKLIMADNLFVKNQEISTNGLNPLTLKVMSDGKLITKGQVEYQVKRVGVPVSTAIPAQFLTVGTKWAGGLVKVSQENSHGTKHRTWQTPFELENQLTTFRRSYKVSGNVENKRLAMPIQLPDGRQVTLWTDWDYYNNELDFAVQRNEDLIFSELNMDANGVVHDFDADSGEVARSGMGLWNMITNKVEYATLTEKKLDETIQDIFFQTTSPVGLNGEYIITGGLGLLRDFDRIMKSSARGFLQLISEDHFMSKGEKGLRYGNYFTEYRHYSGKVIKVVYDQAFDKSARAETSERHPITGLPIMSHSGMALDFSEVETGDGITSNITMLYEEGREFIEKYAIGMAKLSFAPETQFVTTDVDESAVHKMATHGIWLHSPLTCAKFICKVN
jgi:hypothetical protein